MLAREGFRKSSDVATQRRSSKVSSPVAQGWRDVTRMLTLPSPFVFHCIFEGGARRSWHEHSAEASFEIRSLFSKVSLRQVRMKRRKRTPC